MKAQSFIELIAQEWFFPVMFQFHFTNNFFALFYIAFYLKDMQRLKEVGNLTIS